MSRIEDAVINSVIVVSGFLMTIHVYGLMISGFCK